MELPFFFNLTCHSGVEFSSLHLFFFYVRFFSNPGKCSSCSATFCCCGGAGAAVLHDALMEWMNKHTHARQPLSHRLPRSCVCARLLTKWLLTTSGSVVSTFRVTHHDASTNRSTTRCAALRATAALCPIRGLASGRRCAGLTGSCQQKGLLFPLIWVIKITLLCPSP